MKPVNVVLSIVLLAAALAIANPWRGRSESPPTAAGAALESSEASRSSLRVRADGAEDSEPPPAPPLPTADTVAKQRPTPTTVEGLAAVAASIDPQLRNRNLISPRREDAGQEGPGFVEMEFRFDAETADADWSGAAETRILGRISQVAGLELVSLNAECRATICRVKLFHPPGTKVRSSLDAVKVSANEIGFGHAAEVATLGDDGVPISVLYLQRKGI